jgi:MoxR-like ATPase
MQTMPDGAAPRDAAGGDAADRLEALLDDLQRCREEIGKAVVGQDAVIDQLLIGLICGGHVLLEGTPGVGKTLIVQSLGKAAGLSFARIQFTPDLMPADVTGGIVLSPDDDGRMRARFEKGPVFTQILLADEINRATPRTQSSLLEAMQEGTVTAAGETMALPRPFFVLATQNPIEMEGTYQLPEAQIDRFLFRSTVPYPDENALDAILDLTTGTGVADPRTVLSAERILALQRLVREVPIAAHVRRAVARLAGLTQPDRDDVPDQVRAGFRYGLSPRGAQALVLAAKGHALLRGRFAVAFDDVAAMLPPVTGHRIQLTYRGEVDGVDAGALLGRLFARARTEAT